MKNANAQKVTQEIIDFSNKYSENHIILSSRPLDEFVGWSDFKEYSAIALNKEQALSLISKLDYDIEIKINSINNWMRNYLKSMNPSPLIPYY